VAVPASPRSLPCGTRPGCNTESTSPCHLRRPTRAWCTQGKGRAQCNSRSTRAPRTAVHRVSRNPNPNPNPNPGPSAVSTSVCVVWTSPQTCSRLFRWAWGLHRPSDSCMTSHLLPCALSSISVCRVVVPTRTRPPRPGTGSARPRGLRSAALHLHESTLLQREGWGAPAGCGVRRSNERRPPWRQSTTSCPEATTEAISPRSSSGRMGNGSPMSSEEGRTLTCVAGARVEAAVAAPRWAGAGLAHRPEAAVAGDNEKGALRVRAVRLHRKSKERQSMSDLSGACMQAWAHGAGRACRSLKRTRKEVLAKSTPPPSCAAVQRTPPPGTCAEACTMRSASAARFGAVWRCVHQASAPAQLAHTGGPSTEGSAAGTGRWMGRGHLQDQYLVFGQLVRVKPRGEQRPVDASCGASALSPPTAWEGGRSSGLSRRAHLWFDQCCARCAKGPYLATPTESRKPAWRRPEPKRRSRAATKELKRS